MDDLLAMLLWLGAGVIAFVLLALVANFIVKMLQPNAAVRRFLLVAFSGFAGACGAGLAAAVVISVKVPMRSGRRFFGIDWTEWVIIGAALVGFVTGCAFAWGRTRETQSRG